MYVQNAVKDSIKLSLKCLYMVNLDFCIYISEEHYVLSSHLINSNKNIIVYPVNCCSNIQI